ncbi:hypothetical protein [Candidatus Binatus sp.]
MEIIEKREWSRYHSDQQGGTAKTKNGKGVYQSPNGKDCYKTANSHGCN